MSADIIFLYDQVIEHLVRLTWFASSPVLAVPDPISEDIDHVADLLAKRDLLVFAASLRNFAEATGSIAFMKKARTSLSEVTADPPNYHRASGSIINLHQMLSRILHAGGILIVRDPVLLLGWDEVATIYKANPTLWDQTRHPLVRISTEKDKSTLISIDAIVSMSCQYLDGAVKVLSKEMVIARADRDS